MTSARALVALLLASSLTGCAHATWERLEPGALPGAGQYPEAHRLVLVDEQEVRFHVDVDDDAGQAVADVRRRLVLRLLTPEGARVPNIDAYYDRAFSKLLSFRGRVVKPDGKSQELDRARAVDAPAFSGMTLFDDSRVVGLPVPTVPPGTILEQEEVIRRRELSIFQFGQRFGGPDPELVERFVAIVPDGWELEAHALTAAGEPWAPEVTRANGEVRFTWEQKNLEPVVQEPFGDSSAVRARVSVRLKRWTEGGVVRSGLRDAKEVSAWAHELARGTDEATPELRAIAERLGREAGPDLRARARRLHRFVCEEVDYCAIELGYGAWKPQPANEVFALRYGDCKGKANLLHTLLKAAGVESRVALVYAHGGVPRRFELPTAAGNFNHMIVQVLLPEGPLLVDPTQRSVPFGELPFSVAEAEVLPVAEGGEELIRAPALAPEQNDERLQLALRLGADGTLAGTFTLTLRGARASEARELLLHSSGRAQNDALSDWMALSNARLSDLQVTGAKRGDPELEVRGAIGLASGARGSVGGRVLRLSDLGRFHLPVLEDRERRLPVVFPYRSTTSLDLTVQLPDGLGWGTLPPPVALETAHGRYSASWQGDGRQLSARRTFVWKERVMPRDDYQRLRDLVKGVDAADARAVVLRPGTVKAEAAK